MAVTRPAPCRPDPDGDGVSVLLLLGKAPERSPVLPDVIAELRRRGAVVDAVVPAHEGLPEGITDCDVVALRGLRRQTLAVLADLESRGLRCCNRAEATLLTRSRTQTQDRLRAAGVPVPDAASVPDAEGARAWAGGRDVAVKVDDLDAAGGRGEGVAAWLGTGAREPPEPPRLPDAFRGPYLVQEWVAGDGVDRKVYVVGDRIAGLLKHRAPGGRAGSPFAPTVEMRDVAVAAGRAVGLEVFGVDLVVGPAGPVVVDVNAFPSCAGVPDAAKAIATTLLACTARP